MAKNKKRKPTKKTPPNTIPQKEDLKLGRMKLIMLAIMVLSVGVFTIIQTLK